MVSPSMSTEESAEWTLVASVGAIGLGQGRCFVAGDRKVALFRLRNGQIRALDGACPHRAGPLAEGVVGHEIVVCPLHGYKFSLIDGRGLDNEFAVSSFPTQVRDGNVYVYLPAQS